VCGYAIILVSLEYFFLFVRRNFVGMVFRKKKVECHRVVIIGEEKRKALQNSTSPIETTIHIYKNISMHMHVHTIFENRIK